MAKLLGVSKMSVTRCFDELDGFQMNLIDDNKTAGRYFKWGKSKKEFWELIRPYLRNPVEKELRLDCLPPWPLPMSGLSAVSHFSMLGDNTYPTYAISKKALKDLQPENCRRSRKMNCRQPSFKSWAMTYYMKATIPW